MAASKCDAHPKEGAEGGSGELQACQSALGARAAHGADYEMACSLNKGVDLSVLVF